MEGREGHGGVSNGRQAGFVDGGCGGRAGGEMAGGPMHCTDNQHHPFRPNATLSGPQFSLTTSKLTHANQVQGAAHEGGRQDVAKVVARSLDKGQVQLCSPTGRPRAGQLFLERVAEGWGLGWRGEGLVKPPGARRKGSGEQHHNALTCLPHPQQAVLAPAPVRVRQQDIKFGHVGQGIGGRVALGESVGVRCACRARCACPPSRTRARHPRPTPSRPPPPLQAPP